KSFSASKEQLNDATSEPGKVKEGTKCSGVPLAIEYTYYHKKLSRKEFFSSQSVVEDDSGPGKQLPFWT
ncbi:histone-lysine N-methyltransferase SETD1B, partial [Trifolium medium]|nr:histone-lysine N-methyltransferase SETD1B [Trifolium medium]